MSFPTPLSRTRHDSEKKDTTRWSLQTETKSTNPWRGQARFRNSVRIEEVEVWGSGRSREALETGQRRRAARRKQKFVDSLPPAALQQGAPTPTRCRRQHYSKGGDDAEFSRFLPRFPHPGAAMGKATQRRMDFALKRKGDQISETEEYPLPLLELEQQQQSRTKNFGQMNQLFLCALLQVGPPNFFFQAPPLIVAHRPLVSTRTTGSHLDRIRSGEREWCRMQDLFSVPSCFSSGEKQQLPDVPAAPAARSGQSAVTLVYRAEIAGQSRLVTVTWCRNLLTHGMQVSIEGSAGGGKDKTGVGGGREHGNGQDAKSCSACKVEMQPWHFWRKYGAKQFQVDGRAVDVVWDLRAARFSDEPEPVSDYYVAVVSDEEVVLLLGNQKKEAFRRTGSRPSLSLQDAAQLVCKKEHVFSKKRFLTRARFHDKGKLHDISIECSSSNLTGGMDVDMAIKIDGAVNVLVKHLQWKFRGNDCISINKMKVQVYWDAHDWLFGTGMRQALFIFKPEAPPLLASSDFDADEFSDFCLFLYAWKVE